MRGGIVARWRTSLAGGDGQWLAVSLAVQLMALTNALTGRSVVVFPPKHLDKAMRLVFKRFGVAPPDEAETLAASPSNAIVVNESVASLPSLGLA
jgi:hypothetical protein